MRFAHLADCHIGAWRDQKLRDLNNKSFEKAYDRIIKENLDFVIISGDLFHVNLPDLESVHKVTSKIREAKEHGINTYVVYGSHDYSPNAVSMIDILTASGLLTKVMVASVKDEKICLDFVEDHKTGAKLAGISGRSYTMERDYYECLDKEALEKEAGTKIFVLHSAVNEIKPKSAAYDQGINIERLPEGFNYYAGGHIHEFICEGMTNRKTIVYPGPLFGATFTDLEATATGTERGFVIAEIIKNDVKVVFVKNDLIEVEYHHVDGENKTSSEVSRTLRNLVEKAEPERKILLFKVDGVLSYGQVTDINWNQMRRDLEEKGAEYVYINRRGLTTKETPEIKVAGESPHIIEENILKENLSDFKIPETLEGNLKKWAETHFKGESGQKLALKILTVLKQEKQEGETKDDYNSRLFKELYDLIPGRETP